MANIFSPFWHPVLARGFILDWDGVIADTDLDFSGIRNKYFDGKRVPLIEAGKWLSEAHQIELWQDICVLEMEGAEKAVPVRGAFELIEWFEKHSIPWCVVSRNSMESIRLAALRIGFPLPEVTLSRDNGPVKPDPEALWLASDKIGIPYRECAMIGDFLYDMIGARRSGIRGVLVERTGEDWNVWADACFETLEKLVFSLSNPEPIVPWEYHDLVKEKSVDWLRASWKRVISFCHDDREIALRAFRAASLGSGKLSVPSGSTVSIEQWRKWPGAKPGFMGMELSIALQCFLDDHYPMVEVIEDAADGHLVKDGISVESVMEELIN